MEKLLLMMMALVLSIPIWAGEKTVTISRNEGIYKDSEGVYYCYKDGITMTFSSGMNNVNYLVEHQQVIFYIRSDNYVIKKIKFNCLDNTTNDNLDCFYWGPSTIHELGAVGSYTPTGNYTSTGYIGTWVAGTTDSKDVKFRTEGKPVRFGSVEITYDKEFGDIYEKVTKTSEVVNGMTYALVSQYSSRALGKEDYYSNTENLTTFTSTPVTLLDNMNKVKVTNEVQLIKLQSSGDSNRPWYIKVGDNYLRRRSSMSGSGGAANGEGYNLLTVSNVPSGSEQYFRTSISIGGDSYNNNALIRFSHTSSETSHNETFAIRHYNGGSLFRDLDYNTSNNQYANNQRVYLYKPAESHEVTTECIPTDGGYITLSGGILTDDQGRNWSQHFDNVTFFVGPTDGYGIGEVTMTDINTRAVTLLQPTASSDFGNDYSFEMPANDVKITANFLSPVEIDTICNPANGGQFNFINGYTNFSGQYYSNEGKAVTFKPTAADGYIFQSVTITDNGVTTTMTPDADGVYSFVMPGHEVTLTANFEEAHDLYLLGTANGGSWAPTGPKFIFDGENQVYYLDVYFKGDVSTNDEYGHFSLTTKIPESGSTNPWGDIWAYRLVAQHNDFDIWDGRTEHLYKTTDGYNDSYAFKIPAGIYRITVNPEMTEVSITQYHPTVTFDPASGTVVHSGDNVSFTSNLNDLVHAINDQEDAATYSSTDNWGVTASGNTHAVTQDGITTVTGQSSIGYITATGTADYEIIGDLYLLGTANGGTWAPTGPQFTYDANAEEYYIDVYFKGGNVDQGVDPSCGYFSLTTQVGNNWDAIKNYRLAAEYNNYVVDDGSTDVHLYTGEDHMNNAFKIPAGVYHITVNKAKTLMSITEYPLTLTFTPPSGEVPANTEVTITSNLYDLVHGINPDEQSPVNFKNKLNGGDWDNDNTAMITAEGATTTVTAEANLDYIVVPGSAEYQVPAPTVYNITPVVTPEGAGTITAPTGAVAGQTVTFTVATNDGYQLDSVEVTYGYSQAVLDYTYDPSTGVYSFVMPDDDVKIFADYIIPVHNITTIVNPEDAGTIIAPAEAVAGETVTFTVNTNTNYELADVSVTSSTQQLPVTDNGDGTYTFEMPDGNVTITANMDLVTPLHFIEDQTSFIKNDTEVTVADELIGTWTAKQYVWAKDQVLSNEHIEMSQEGNVYDYVRTVLHWQTKEWDQSNWVMLDFSEIPDFNWNSTEGRQVMKMYVDHKIKAGTIKGTYYCNGNSNDQDAIDQFVGKTNHRIVLSELPEFIVSEETQGYPGYIPDPTEEEQLVYNYNQYMAANFFLPNLRAEGVNYCNNDNNLVYDEDVYGTYREPLAPYDYNLFFMKPKNQEVAHVWGVWAGTVTYVDSYTEKQVTKDLFETYIPNASVNPHLNSYAIPGVFAIDHWNYNRLPSPDESPAYGKPGVDGDPEDALHLNEAYLFHIVIQYDVDAQDENPSGLSKSPNRMPMRDGEAQAPQAADYNAGFYKVYPLDLGSHSDSYTSVYEMGSLASTEIDSIRYYNVMGQESTTPFDGINIMVIRYKDGSFISKKVLR